ncbi:hypothetical protein F442_22369 [Phytophthora nicotianae P10297]|uniref:Uncharacterized protein n=1 Tax=Phytophthora nicotianae P10297 TaxID=1317064 RepID=W2Y136_PHYNI|nr:hypothetical protein F442_22369 [Phytophthora nicotianae P10297]
MAGEQFLRSLPSHQRSEQEDRASNPRSAPAKARHELGKQQELGTKIESQSEA